MDNIKLILIMTWVFMGLLVFQSWQEDYGHAPQISQSQTAQDSATPTVPVLNGNKNDVPPALALAQPSGTAVPNSDQLVTAATATNTGYFDSQQRIKVKTDLLDIEIDSIGGDIRLVNLLKYPENAKQKEIPITLFNDTPPQLFILQSGLLSNNNSELAPNHVAQYKIEQNSYELKDGTDELSVRLLWDNGAGIQVEKTYLFKRGSYNIDVSHTVHNQSGKAWQGQVYGQLQRNAYAGENTSRFLYTYTGAAVKAPESRFEKIKFEEIEEVGKRGYINKQGELSPSAQPAWSGGWVAMLQHYFVAAIIPPKQENFLYYSSTPSAGRYVLGGMGSGLAVADGANQQFDFQFYVGPKLQDDLKLLAEGLELTVDYGWLWFIAQPLFHLLKWLYSFLGNWGWAVIFLTMLIKLAFYKLSAASYRSMANMRRMQPRLAALKERYSDDRSGLNQAMMDLYRKEKINPLGGCLPIVIQIPVFIALYWVLLESVELRQASFILWWQDLSSPDPYFVLPLLMGVTMFIQQKLNPAPLDPIQAKVMMFLPIIFTVFFAFFPAGLVLYWVVNNTLSIVQQWIITKKIAG